MNQNRKIISLVTPIIDSANGKVGVIESAMTMENMFPSLYEGIEDEWSFFYSDEGVTYFGQKEQTESSALLDDILKQRPTEDKIQTIYKKLDGKKLVISYMQVRELSGTLICVKDITKMFIMYILCVMCLWLSCWHLSYCWRSLSTVLCSIC